MTKWKGEVASYAPQVTTFLSGAAGTVSAGFLPLALMTGLAASPAQAADLYWDANGTATGSGGSGNWNTTDQLWSESNSDVLGPYRVWDNSALNNAVFGLTAAGTTTAVGTINLTEPISVHNMTFQTVNNWVIGGNTLTLGGVTPTINTIGHTTINSILAGTSGLTKTGGAQLYLTGANSFSGGITLSGGTLRATNSAALGDAGNGVTTTADASLVIDSGATNRTVTIGAGTTLTVGGAGTAPVFYTGGGSLNVNPNNSLTNDANNYTGPTRLLGQSQGSGSISFTSVRNLGEASALGAPTTVADGTIQFIGGSQYSSSIIYVGDGDTSNRNWALGGGPGRVFRQRGTGALTLTGDISVVNAAFLAETADLNLLGVLSGTGGITFAGSAAGSVTLGSANTFAGVAGISGGIVRAPVLADGGVASSLGTASSVNFGNLGQLSYTGAGASSNRSWSLNAANAILNDGSGALTLSGNAAYAAGGPIDTLTFGGSFAGTSTFSGVISGDGNLASSGSGTWVVDGANTRTGTITVNGGTLRAGNASAFGTTTGITTTGGTLDLNGFDMSATSLTGTGGAVALGGANLALTLGTGVTNGYGGSITGSGTLTKLGAGTLTLTGVNSYAGATTLGGGTLALDFSPAGGPTSNILPTTSSLVMSGGTLAVTGAAGETNSQSVNGLAITGSNNTVSARSGSAGSLTLNLGTITRTAGLANFVLPTAGAITTTNIDGALGGWATVNGSDYAKVQGGNILAFTAADYVNKDNASTWLSNEIISDAGGTANTPYSGTVAGSVQIGGLQYTAAANSTVSVGAGNTLGVDGTIIVAPSVGGANQLITGGSMTGTLGGGVLGVQQNGTGTFTIASQIANNTGTIGFTKSGTGKVTLSGLSTYTGATMVAQGTLSVNSIANGGAASAIGASGSASSNLVIEGGTLEYTGGSASSDRGFTFARSGAVTSDTISVTNAAANLTLSGQVVSSDGATLVKDGAGTLTLAGSNNSFTGATTVNAGALAVPTLANGGVNSSIGAAGTASSNLVLQNGGALQYMGATGSTNRGFTVGAGGGRIAVSQLATTLTMSGTAVGTGGLTKDGAGTLILSGANTYTGGTRVTAGTLRAGSAAAFGATNQLMTVDAGATLDLAGIDNTVGALNGGGLVTLDSATLTANGNNGSFSGMISGTGGFTKGSGGTQTFVGCNNSYTGATTIQGVLAVDCLANGGAASGIGASGSASSNLMFLGSMLRYTGGTVTTDRGFTLQSTGQFDVSNAATTLTFTGDVTGAGQVQKYGAGTLVLAGNNNNTGGVNAQAGILRAGSATAFGTGSFTLANVAGAAIDLNGYNMSPNVISGGGAAGGTIALGSGTLTLTGGTATYSGLITGTGGLVKAGGGTQVLDGCASNYTGATSITGGQVQVQCLTIGGVNSSIGASSNAAGNLVVNNGILTYIGAGNSTDRLMTIGGTAQILSSGTGAVNFTNAGAIVFANLNTAQTIRLGGSNTNDNRFGLRLDNNGTGVTSFVKQDAGTWILTNPASTYSGVTQILGGVLGVDKLSNSGAASSIGASSNAASNLTIGSGSTLRYTGSGDSTDRRFTLAVGTTFIESSGTGAVNFTDTGAVSYSGVGARVMALGGSNAGDNIMGATIGDQNVANITSLAKNDPGKWILTGYNTYTGITNVNAGTLVIGNGGTTGSIVSSTINNAGVLGFNRSDTLTIAGDIHGIGSMRQLGTGTTILTGTNVYTGGTAIAQGTLQLGNGGTTGTIVGDVLDNGTLAFNWNDGKTFAAKISGTGAVHQMGSGTTILAGTNSYQGGTSITAGTLLVSSDANLGAASGGLAFNGGGTLNTTASFISSRATNLQGAGTFSINSGTTLTLTGAVSGAGALTKAGDGTLILAGNNSYQGATDIDAGTVFVNGNQAGATGPTSVASGATLGGTGTIGGSVTIANGGTLSPGGAGSAPGALTINGGLTLNNASNVNVNFGQANVPGGALNDLVNVGGDLTLDGTLNITQTPGGTFGPGVYRVFNYGGVLIDNGLNLTDPNYFVQTAVANQVNLVNSAGLALSFWDGDAGPHSNSAVNGGNGTWRAAGDTNWTDSTGLFAAPFANGSFAIFQGAAGTVDVENGNGQVQATGMQFATNGYVVEGNPVVLVDDPTQAGLQSIIRVGDGTAAGAAYAATINSDLSGATQLVKTDLGTLVLAGTNSYGAGTAINGGTLQVSADGNLGAATGGLAMAGGTLHNTAAFSSGRAVTLNAGGGTFRTDNLTTLTLNGAIAGAGTLTKTDGGTLVLAGTNNYLGGTTINGGTVEVATDANLGNAASALSFGGGALHTTASFASARTATLNAGGGIFATDAATTLTLNGTMAGAGALTKAGAGTLVLNAANTYSGGTTIAGGTLQLGAGGATGSLDGNVANNGTLVFNRNDSYAFAGLISGGGVVDQIGSGVTILTADNAYGGSTNVREGTLVVNGNQSAATGATTVEAGGALGGVGTVGGDVAVLDGGALNPGNVGAVPGTLTISGALTLATNSTLNYNFGQAGVVGGAYNDLTVVQGNLTLDGTVAVTQTPGGDFGPGIYRIISYGGVLTDLGLVETSPDHVVQTSVAGQVNLVNTSGVTLNYWDGDALALHGNDRVNGGAGTWRAASDDNWTEDTGHLNAAFANGAFAIFAGTAGNVGVDNTNGQVQASGMQFASDGYRIEGDAIELVGPESIIRVGDGTLPAAGYTATVASVLGGNSRLVKTDLGTLVLSGVNTYAGGTEIRQGTLQFSSDANLGIGGLVLDGGTLRNTVTIDTARGVTLGEAGGTFQTDANLTLSGAFDGTGGFTKTGSAALILNGSASHQGSTTVSAGSLYINGNHGAATGPTSVAGGATLGGTGTIGGNVTIADGAMLSPGAADGTPGALAIAGNLALSGGSILNYSLGQANAPGGALNDLVTVGGNLVLDGTLNVSVPSGGTFGPGIYRLFDYAGTLTNNGLAVGAIPSVGYFVQTAIANQVNLVNTAGLNLNYWDGAAGPKFDGTINGGDGRWQGSAGNDNWTESTGMVNASYADGAFAIFAGKAGTVSVDNGTGQVTASGMQFMTDGYVIARDSLELVGPASTIRVGDGTGATVGATIASQITGNSRLVKTDGGTLVLSGANSYDGGTAINGGTLQVSSDANLGAASGDLGFDGGALHTTASFTSARSITLPGQGTMLTDAGTTLTLTGALAGGGSFIKGGSGTVRIASDASGYFGTAAVEEGTLAVDGKLCGTVDVRDGGRLQGTGTVCDTNNHAGGTVAPGNGIGTLTVAGNYVGSGGTLEIESALGGAASPSDRLVVTGDTSGTTNVKVVNLGGSGAQTIDGIKIVDVGGTSGGHFSLLGDYAFEGEQAVVSGAYAYRLYQNGIATPSDGDWYLRSTYMNPYGPQPLYQPGVPIYEAYAGILQTFNQLGTLQQRVGNRSWSEAVSPQGADVPGAGAIDGKGIWARIEAAHTDIDPRTSTTGTGYDVTSWRLQAGLDGLLHEVGAGILIGGITVHYGTVSSRIASVFGSGAIDAAGYGLGGTLTWYGSDGFYVDAQAEATWYDSDLKSATLGTKLADGNDGFGYAVSIETGRKFALTENWSLTPQVQLAYSAVDFDTFTDPFGARVSLGDSESLTGRLGLSADYERQWADAAGRASRAHLYGIANLYYDLLDPSAVDVSGARFVSQNQKLWGGLGLGGSLDWADGRYAVYGEALVRTSLQDFGDSRSIGAKLGFSVRW
ncbi:autotransporter-associated beta strand repeat-containing protein [Mesorhizobium retamae]|uniref:Autotransporter outer membrane beta-barrel domain-containing protein n=1 Tax=Mesorhizobium retamae TaxID=2912854 RepID=A0ABS9QNE6_9HYPH|nr:autotransporter-associated beta strand repeat-containing protein [Mesorhizobium sp. IRAMC:0171]MCG7508976.1 autotransporter outer membrane beta-barrel domain-containing protein [Mesorhizobium sp. IRAMC:0171]